MVGKVDDERDERLRVGMTARSLRRTKAGAMMQADHMWLGANCPDPFVANALHRASVLDLNGEGCSSRDSAAPTSEGADEIIR
jgi:hypothetical protein